MTNRKHNAAVYFLSSRVYMLKKVLELFYENWNAKYEYPVYIHHFDDIYSQELIDDIRQSISENISFHQIDYGVPHHIKEKDLFYNRRYLKYVRKTFPISRMGYLHMEHFFSNLHKFGAKGCLVKELEHYDYTMNVTDHSWFKKKVDYDFFDSVVDTPIATAYSWCHKSLRHEETTEYLWQFYLTYLKSKKIDPAVIKNAELREAVITQLDSDKFPRTIPITCGNMNIYNVKMLLDAGFGQWMDAVNEYGGQYKHRWGDIETLALFAATNFEKPFCDLDLVRNGFYEKHFPGSDDFAPSVYDDGRSRGSRIKSKVIDQLIRLGIKK